MNNDIASSLGAGSGINVAALVRDLAAASREPKVNRINELTQQNQARISAVAQARSDLDGLADSLAEIVSDGTLRSAPTVSDDSVLTASANPGVSAAAFAASIEVVQLARAQTLVSGVAASRTAPIGQGGLTLTVGSTSVPITIDASNDSLDGLAAAINQAGTSVRANIVGDAGGFRIILKGETGANNSFSLSLDSGSEPSLGSYASGSGGLSVAQSASDAGVRIDGVLLNRPTNTISDILPGITLNLKKATPGQTVDIGSSRPTDAIRQAFGDFVSVFNQLRGSIKAAVQLAGPSAGLRQLDSELSGLAALVITSHPAINRLADVGISTTRDGTLLLDKAKLDQAIARDPAAVEALFNPLRDATRTPSSDPGLGAALDGIRDRALASNGAVERAAKSLEARRAALTASLAKIEERESAYAARLERQYGTLDSRIGALRATQAYLKQQIDLWNNQGRG